MQPRILHIPVALLPEDWQKFVTRCEKEGEEPLNKAYELLHDYAVGSEGSQEKHAL